MALGYLLPVRVRIGRGRPVHRPAARVVSAYDTLFAVHFTFSSRESIAARHGIRRWVVHSFPSKRQTTFPVPNRSSTNEPWGVRSVNEAGSG